MAPSNDKNYRSANVKIKISLTTKFLKVFSKLLVALNMGDQLAIDIGNSRTKFGLFQGRELVKLVHIPNNELVLNRSLLLDWKPSSIIVSSVNKEAETELRLHELKIPIVYLNYKTKLPIEIAYETPETLGKDRIAAVVGAKSLAIGKNLLVIDAGTCITYDFLTSESVYLGGAISPGVQMRLGAMNNFTSQLPLIDWGGVKRPENVGRTTISSMLSGAVNGLIGEMNAFISDYKKQYPELKIVITGGDANFFEKELKNGIFADQNLVLKGLNEILIDNQK